MISIIIYGRNDDHGYHYKKRSAISINAMAEVLTDADDEILFVDYNTPNDLPTMPESILSNLTQRAKQKLRVIRVRPEFHNRFAATTHLKIIEPIARNIALRRANPNNRWILSTNSDMIFVPQDKSKSLTSIVEKLEDGFYQLPRFEFPEFLWESLFENPREPEAVLNSVRDYADQLHLKIAASFNNILLYDNPGDFQLALHDDLRRIDGFDERMVLGWTVDSNLCKRMFLLRGEVKHLEDQLDAYHCNHTRKESLLHNHKSVYNSAKEFFDDVTVAELPMQRQTWGYPEEQFEEIDFNQTDFIKFKKALAMTLTTESSRQRLFLDGDDDSQYDRRYIFPFVVDHLASLHPQTMIAYVGYNKTFADQLKTFWAAMGKVGKIYCPNLDESECSVEQCKVFIVDLLPTANQSHEQDIKCLRKYFETLNRLLAKVPNRKQIKFIGINIDKCNRQLKFKKAINVVARNTVSNTIYGYLKP